MARLRRRRRSGDLGGAGSLGETITGERAVTGRSGLPAAAPLGPCGASCGGGLQPPRIEKNTSLRLPWGGARALRAPSHGSARGGETTRSILRPLLEGARALWCPSHGSILGGGKTEIILRPLREGARAPRAPSHGWILEGETTRSILRPLKGGARACRSPSHGFALGGIRTQSFLRPPREGARAQRAPLQGWPLEGKTEEPIARLLRMKRGRTLGATQSCAR